MHGFPVRTPICHIAPISRIYGGGLLIQGGSGGETGVRSMSAGVGGEGGANTSLRGQSPHQEDRPTLASARLEGGHVVARFLKGLLKRFQKGLGCVEEVVQGLHCMEGFLEALLEGRGSWKSQRTIPFEGALPLEALIIHLRSLTPQPSTKRAKVHTLDGGNRALVIGF